MSRFALVLVFAVLAFALARAEAPHLEPYTLTIPGSPVEAEMAPVPFRGDAPGFWIERHEVTQAEYAAFVVARSEGTASTPASRTLSSLPDVSPPGLPASATVAAEVSQAEAVEYSRWLTRLAGRSYRLPTEAEWEQACWAGQDGEAPLEGRAWFADNARALPHAVGTRAPDRLGLFDMLGNVPEWTVEPAGKLPLAAAPVVKGGSWSDSAESLDCHARREASSGSAGFRVISPYEGGRR